MGVDQMGRHLIHLLFFRGAHFHGVLIPSEARLYPHSIDIFRHRRRQPEVGLKTSISQEWCTGSLSDWQA